MIRPTYYAYQTPVGKITIGSDGESIVRIAFGDQILEGSCGPSTLTNEASTELLQYLSGKRTSFDVPFRAEGTEFQLSVWKEVLGIPYGQTRSYAQIASALGNAKATRAVGMANNRNPLPILIPCHRVIGSNGKPVGYAGGVKVKQFLLDIERSAVQ